MSGLNAKPEIIQLASSLKVDWRQNAVGNIVALCHRKISEWLKGAFQVTSIRHLEELVCQRLSLVFEEIWSDEDLVAVIRKYVALGEPVFATLKTDLDSNTFAALIERRLVNGVSKDRYVAVIDCRGEKAHRRFFTRWHEIAHLLTLDGQLELPLHRSTTEESPMERLMDVIAGEVGFYDPLFRPIVLEEIERDGGLYFRTIERIRNRFAPEASFQATMNACVKRLAIPILTAEIGLGFKKSENAQIRSRQGDIIPAKRPQAKLRVISIHGNEAAKRTPLQIHRNMRVPESSVIYEFYFDPDGFSTEEFEGTENLKTWRHSDGSSLAEIKVRIKARRAKDRVLAIIQTDGN